MHLYMKYLYLRARAIYNQPCVIGGFRLVAKAESSGRKLAYFRLLAIVGVRVSKRDDVEVK